MQATQRPFSVAAFTEPSGNPAWQTIPSWYLLATQDNAIPPKTQEFMASVPAPTSPGCERHTSRCCRSQRPPPS